MIRRLVEWILDISGIRRRRRVRKSGLESLMDLLPVVFAVNAIIGTMRQFGPIYSLPWHKRMWRRVVRFFKRIRLAVIGW